MLSVLQARRQLHLRKSQCRGRRTAFALERIDARVAGVNHRLFHDCFWAGLLEDITLRRHGPCGWQALCFLASLLLLLLLFKFLDGKGVGERREMITTQRECHAMSLWSQDCRGTSSVDSSRAMAAPATARGC